MNPLLIAGILGGGTALNEMLSGREQERRDAALKAEAYRVMPYTGIDPTSWSVYKPDPLGKGLASGVSGYQLGSNINTNSAYSNALKAFANNQNAKAGLPLPSLSSVPSDGLDPIPEADFEVLDADRRNDYRLARTPYSRARAARGYLG